MKSNASARRVNVRSRRDTLARNAILARWLTIISLINETEHLVQGNPGALNYEEDWEARTGLETAWSALIKVSVVALEDSECKLVAGEEPSPMLVALFNQFGMHNAKGGAV